MIPETTVTAVALDPEMAQRLRRAARKVDKLNTATAAALVERDAVIREAVAAGASLREVGAAVGLSHTAVKFVAHGRTDR